MTDIRLRNQCPGCGRFHVSKNVRSHTYYCRECGWRGPEPKRVMHKHKNDRLPKFLKVVA